MNPIFTKFITAIIFISKHSLLFAVVISQSDLIFKYLSSLWVLGQNCDRYLNIYLKIDLSLTLEEQGPYHVIIHKLSDLIAKADQGNECYRHVCIAFENYIKAHPETLIIDPFTNVRLLLNRFLQYKLIRKTVSSKINDVVDTPNFTILELNEHSCKQTYLKLLKRYNIKFPLICKPIEAHGAEWSHDMSLVFGEKHLIKTLNILAQKCCDSNGEICDIPHKTPEPNVNTSTGKPCRQIVVQSFVKHNATLFKVFVIGEVWYVVRRPSLKNFSAGDHPTIHFRSNDVSRADACSTLNQLDDGGLSSDESVHSITTVPTTKMQRNLSNKNIENTTVNKSNTLDFKSEIVKTKSENDLNLKQNMAPIDNSNIPASTDQEQYHYGIKPKKHSTLRTSPLIHNQLSPNKLNHALVGQIVRLFSATLGLSLFGMDIIRDKKTGKLYIIDINVFPGYDGVPDFFKALFRLTLQKLGMTSHIPNLDRELGLYSILEDETLPPPLNELTTESNTHLTEQHYKSDIVENKLTQSTMKPVVESKDIRPFPTKESHNLINPPLLCNTTSTNLPITDNNINTNNYRAARQLKSVG